MGKLFFYHFVISALHSAPCAIRTFEIGPTFGELTEFSKWYILIYAFSVIVNAITVSPACLGIIRTPARPDSRAVANSYLGRLPTY